MQERKTPSIVNTELELCGVLQAITMENTTLFNAEWDLNYGESTNPDGWLVRIRFKRPDTETGKEGYGYGRREFIARGSSVDSVVKTCWLLMELLLRHELMEAFRYQGCRVFNPHHSIEELQGLEKARTQVTHS